MCNEEKSEIMDKMMVDGILPMMKGMMCGEKGERRGGFNPMDMCKKMMQTDSRSNEMAEYDKPELRGLFEDWLQQINEEILEYIKKEGKVIPENIAKKLNLSIESVNTILGKLAQQGKL